MGAGAGWMPDVDDENSHHGGWEERKCQNVKCLAFRSDRMSRPEVGTTFELRSGEIAQVHELCASSLLDRANVK